MAEVFKLTLTKADLDKIPSDERTFYLMAGQVANDINILGKLVIFAINGRPAGQAERWAGMTITFLLVKLFAGRLFEGNELIKTAFLGRKLRAKYIDSLNPQAKDGLENINRYFGKKNAIERVRNKFSFHFDTPEVERLYAKLGSDAQFTDLLAEVYIGHNLFYGAEILSFNAMAEAMEEPNMSAALDTLVKDTVQISVWMGLFIADYLGLIRNKYIGVRREDVESITVDDSQSVSSVSLPFFCGPPSGR